MIGFFLIVSEIDHFGQNGVVFQKVAGGMALTVRIRK